LTSECSENQCAENWQGQPHINVSDKTMQAAIFEQFLASSLNKFSYKYADQDYSHIFLTSVWQN
jgi:hypothetical protein